MPPTLPPHHEKKTHRLEWSRLGCLQGGKLQGDSARPSRSQSVYSGEGPCMLPRVCTVGPPGPASITSQPGDRTWGHRSSKEDSPALCWAGAACAPCRLTPG